MKRLFSALLIIVIVGALVSCSKPLQSTNTTKNDSEEYTISELQETATALHQRRKRTYSYVHISVNGEIVAMIYIGKLLNVIAFLEAKPQKQARLDLNLLLEKTGREFGTVEYYNSIHPQSPKMIYSISGTLSSAETKRY